MNNKVVLTVILLAVYFTLIFALFVFWRPNDLPDSSSQWQAVFLTDGQVYFGKLENHNRKFAVLTSVYYLKYGSALQQDRLSTTSPGAAQNLNLIKLGGEVHGPEDKMFIAKDKILFVENLKDVSTVVKAILGTQMR